MRFKIKNWKLALLALIFICLFTYLGVWQVHRATEKKILLKSFAARTQHTPLSAKALATSSDLRFYRVQLTGSFDNQYSLFLDNKTYNGLIGYEVYTPFKAKGLDEWILVDRGFVPMGRGRAVLPDLHNITGTVTLTGMLNLPPTYVSLGKHINESTEITWPLRIEYVNLAEISPLIHGTLFHYIVMLPPHDPAGYDITWQIVIMGPERHMGYAVQWFAFALTLLILFVALNRDKSKKQH